MLQRFQFVAPLKGSSTLTHFFFISDAGRKLKSVSVQTLSCTYVTDLKLQTSLNVWCKHSFLLIGCPTGRTAARTTPLPLSNADPGVL